MDEIDAYVLLVRAFTAERKIVEARAARNHSWALATKCNVWRSHFDIALNVARVTAAEKHYAAAIRKERAEVRDAQQVGCTSCELQASLLLAEACLRSRNGGLARTQFQAVAPLRTTKGSVSLLGKLKTTALQFKLPQTAFLKIGASSTIVTL